MNRQYGYLFRYFSKYLYYDCLAEVYGIIDLMVVEMATSEKLIVEGRANQVDAE